MRVFVFFFCFLFLLPSIKGEKTDFVRDLLMRAQLGSDADVGLGKMLDALFVKALTWLPRTSVYSFVDGKVKLDLNAPERVNIKSLNYGMINEMINQLVQGNGSISERFQETEFFDNAKDYEEILDNMPGMTIIGGTNCSVFTDGFNECYEFDANGLVTFSTLTWIIESAGKGVSVTSSFLLDNDDIPNFYQGVFFTSFFAIVPLLLTCCWQCVLCCTCCYCCIRCFSCKKMREKKFRMMNPGLYKKRFYVYKGIQIFCRAFILIFSLWTLVLMCIWGLFAFQSHIGLSNSLDKADDDFVTVADYGKQVGDVPTSTQNVADSVIDTADDALNAIWEILPIGDMIDDGIDCANHIIDSLPKIDNITNFVIGLNDTLNNLDSLLNFTELTGNLTSIIDDMTNMIPTVVDALAEAIAGTIDITSQMEYLNGVLDDINDFYPDMEAYDQLVAEIQIIQNEKDTTLTVGFLADLAAEFGDCNNMIPDDMIPKLQTYRNSLGVISGVNITGMNATLNQMIANQQNLPDFNAVNQKIEGLNDIFGSAVNTSLDIESLLSSLNFSMGDFATFIDEEIDNIFFELNATIFNLIPDFSPLLDELNKITTIGSQAECIYNITDAIEEFNNTVMILPSSISSMITQFSNITNFLNFDIDFDETLGEVTDLKSIIAGQLQNVTQQVDYYNSTTILAMLPDLSSMDLGLDGLSQNFSGALTAFNITYLKDFVSIANSSLTSLELFDNLGKVFQFFGILSDTSSANNSVNSAISILSTDPSPADACSTGGTCPTTECVELLVNVMAMNESLHSSEYGVDALYNQLIAINETRSQIPSSDSILGDINLVNLTSGLIPNLTDYINDLDIMNFTLNDALPFNEFADMMNSFLESADAFDIGSITGALDSASEAYNSLNLTEVFDQIEGIKDMIEPIFDYIPNLLNNLTNDAIEFMNETMDTAVGYIDDVLEVKDDYLEKYVYQFDGYRLLIAMFVIIIFLPLPSLYCFACCCRDGCFSCFGGDNCCFLPCWQCSIRSCCLLCWSLVLVTISIFFWITPVFGLPFAVLIDDGCDGVTGYLKDGVDVAAEQVGSLDIGDLLDEYVSIFPNLSSILNESAFEDILKNGLTASFTNDLVEVMMKVPLDYLNDIDLPFNISDKLTIDLDFETISLKNVIDNYLDKEEACQGDDLINIAQDIFNATLVSLVAAVADMLPEVDLPMGFRFHPKFPSLLKNITFPIITNLTDIGDEITPYLGCEKFNSMYNIGYEAICTTGRFSFMFLWGIFVILALILTSATCCACCSYCFLEHVYTSSEADKRGGYDDVEAYDEELDDGEDMFKEGDEPMEQELEDTSLDLDALHEGEGVELLEDGPEKIQKESEFDKGKDMMTSSDDDLGPVDF